MKKVQTEQDKNTKEQYILQLCKNLIKKLQKLVLSMSYLQNLPKKPPKSSQSKPAAFIINSIRKKVMKELFYQIKEYFQQNLLFFVERQEKHIRDYDKQQKKHINQKARDMPKSLSSQAKDRV